MGGGGVYVFFPKKYFDAEFFKKKNILASKVQEKNILIEDFPKKGYISNKIFCLEATKKYNVSSKARKNNSG